MVDTKRFEKNSNDIEGTFYLRLFGMADVVGEHSPNVAVSIKVNDSTPLINLYLRMTVYVQSRSVVRVMRKYLMIVFIIRF